MNILVEYTTAVYTCPLRKIYAEIYSVHGVIEQSLGEKKIHTVGMRL